MKKEYVNETYISEALKSSKLRNLLSMEKSPNSLLKAIYGATKIKLDKIEDHTIIDIDPKEGPKTDGYVLYYTTQEKENPYAEDGIHSTYLANSLLALGKGKKMYYVSKKTHGYFKGKKYNFNAEYDLTTNPKGSFSDYKIEIGPNKDYAKGYNLGYSASGLGSLKRVIDVADAAFVIDPDALETTHDIIKSRTKAKSGAIAFKSDKEFKAENMKRYNDILLA